MTICGAGEQQILLQYLLPPLLVQHRIVQLANIVPRQFHMLRQLPWWRPWAVMAVLCAAFYVYFATLWLMQDGERLRQLADYEYSAEGDLISAHDEHRRTWHYAYRHHLITRYTDRTGRGMKLQWLGEGPDAKAVHEWADDGSYEVRLEWARNIRLTYVTDALGHETKHYYDILGYTASVWRPLQH